MVADVRIVERSPCILLTSCHAKARVYPFLASFTAEREFSSFLSLKTFVRHDPEDRAPRFVAFSPRWTATLAKVWIVREASDPGRPPAKSPQDEGFRCGVGPLGTIRGVQNQTGTRQMDNRTLRRSGEVTN